MGRDGEGVEMVAILIKTLIVIVVLIMPVAGGIYAAEYEEKVIISDDAGSSSSGYNNDPVYTPPTPGYGNTGNQNRSNRNRKGSNNALQDSAKKAGGSIIEAIGDAIGQTIRESANQGNTASSFQSKEQASPSAVQPYQENTPGRRRKKITDID
jgi:hypothetical protein